MISPELLRRYPFFAGLSANQLTLLAQAADEKEVGAGEYLFHEGQPLEEMFLAVDGNVDIVLELPAQDVQHKVSEQLLGEMETNDVVVTTVGPGEIFAWSALLPPHKATASGKTTTLAHLVVFNGPILMQKFVEDPAFGFVMTQKVAGVMRERLQALRIESLASLMA